MDDEFGCFIGFIICIVIMMLLVAAGLKTKTVTVKGKWWRTTTSACTYTHAESDLYRRNQIRFVQKSGAWHDPVVWDEVEVKFPAEVLAKNIECSVVVVTEDGTEIPRKLEVSDYDKIEVGKRYKFSSIGGLTTEEVQAEDESH